MYQPAYITIHCKRCGSKRKVVGAYALPHIHQNKSKTVDTICNKCARASQEELGYFIMGNFAHRMMPGAKNTLCGAIGWSFVNAYSHKLSSQEEAEDMHQCKRCKSILRGP